MYKYINYIEYTHETISKITFPEIEFESHSKYLKVVPRFKNTNLEKNERHQQLLQSYLQSSTLLLEIVRKEKPDLFIVFLRHPNRISIVFVSIYNLIFIR